MGNANQIWLALSILILLVLMACASVSKQQQPRIGDPAVHERIDSLTDCDALRIEFNLAKGNLERTRHDDNEQRKINSSYAQAAQERLDELRC